MLDPGMKRVRLMTYAMVKQDSKAVSLRVTARSCVNRCK